MKELKFEEITDKDTFSDYTGDCSGNRSDCCTRVCTRNNYIASEEEWGKFLNIEGGVVQY